MSNNSFSIVIETTVTYFSDGYIDESCEVISQELYENSVVCTDKFVQEFIRYIRAQPYAEDTVIVAIGDHMSMEQ